MIGTTKLAGAVVAGVLGVAVTGASALATFQAPDPASVAATVGSSDDQARNEKDPPEKHDKKHDKVKDILDKLVAAGTITQAQEDAILKAFAEAAGRERRDHEEGAVLKRILSDMMKLSADYLGLPKDQLEKDLRDGQTLCEIANTTSGKSCDGLATADTTGLTAQIDKAVADGKISKERADKIKGELTAKVGEFIHHKFERKPTAANKDKRPEVTTPREVKPLPSVKPSPSASPTT